MSSKTKTTTNQQQQGSSTATYNWMPPPETADVQALRGMVSPVQVDPSISYGYASAREGLNNSYHNPLGAYTSPAVRDAANRSAGKRLAMDEAQAASASRLASQEARFGQQSYIAQLTDPRLVQTGGTSSGTMSGTQVQSYNPGIGSYIGQAAGIGVGLL